VFVIPVVSLVYEVVSMTLGYFSDAAKVSSLMKDHRVASTYFCNSGLNHTMSCWYNLHAKMVKDQQIL
jgi:hypothetical protein